MTLKTLAHLAEISIALARNGMTLDIETIDRFMMVECNSYGNPDGENYIPAVAEIARLDRMELATLNEAQQTQLLAVLNAIVACQFIRL